jgi:hypothetical protein
VWGEWWSNALNLRFVRHDLPSPDDIVLYFAGTVVLMAKCMIDAIKEPITAQGERNVHKEDRGSSQLDEREERHSKLI